MLISREILRFHLYFSAFSLVLVSIKEIYQTLRKAFNLIAKHVKNTPLASYFQLFSEFRNATKHSRSSQQLESWMKDHFCKSYHIVIRVFVNLTWIIVIHIPNTNCSKEHFVEMYLPLKLTWTPYWSSKFSNRACIIARFSLSYNVSAVTMVTTITTTILNYVNRNTLTNWVFVVNFKINVSCDG